MSSVLKNSVRQELPEQYAEEPCCQCPSCNQSFSEALQNANDTGPAKCFRLMLYVWLHVCLFAPDAVAAPAVAPQRRYCIGSLRGSESRRRPVRLLQTIENLLKGKVKALRIASVKNNIYLRCTYHSHCCHRRRRHRIAPNDIYKLVTVTWNILFYKCCIFRLCLVLRKRLKLVLRWNFNVSWEKS